MWPCFDQRKRRRGTLVRALRCLGSRLRGRPIGGPLLLGASAKERAHASSFASASRSCSETSAAAGDGGVELTDPIGHRSSLAAQRDAAYDLVARAAEHPRRRARSSNRSSPSAHLDPLDLAALGAEAADLAALDTRVSAGSACSSREAEHLDRHRKLSAVGAQRGRRKIEDLVRGHPGEATADVRAGTYPLLR